MKVTLEIGQGEASIQFRAWVNDDESFSLDQIGICQREAVGNGMHAAFPWADRPTSGARFVFRYCSQRYAPAYYIQSDGTEFTILIYRTM